jgi:hypothetical protein
MQRTSIALASLALFFAACPLWADDSRKEISLSLAVKEFNQRTSQRRDTAGQLPLTEDEVVAAIRRWHPAENPPLSEEMQARFQEVAESRVMPPDAYFAVVQVSHVRGYRYEVWKVLLTLKTGEKSGAILCIRDQCISSRKIRPEEQRELDRQFSALKGQVEGE